MGFVRIYSSTLIVAAFLAGSLEAGIGVLKADSYVTSGSPSSNFGATPLLNVGAGASAVLQFDFAPVISNLLNSPFPTSATPIIGKATLTVYVSKAATAGTLAVAPLLSSWTENTITYGTLPMSGSPLSSTPVAAGGQFVQLDVTHAVNGWIGSDNNPSSANYVGGANYGLVLSSPDGGVFVLDSKEGTSTSHAAQLDIELASDFNGILRKDLTLSAPGYTSLASIHLTGTNTAGGRIWYMVRATDGVSQIATEEGVIQFLATANSITCTVQATDKLHLGTVNSGCTPGFFNPLSQPGISVYDNVSFSSPAPIAVHEVYFRVMNISGATIRLEP
jgi:hypothetical protein